MIEPGMAEAKPQADDPMAWLPDTINFPSEAPDLRRKDNELRDDLDWLVGCDCCWLP